VFGIGPNTLKSIVRDNGEIGIKILDELLGKFITSLVVILGQFKTRVEGIFKLGIYVQLYEKETGGRVKRKGKVWTKHLRQYKEAYKWYIFIFICSALQQ